MGSLYRKNGQAMSRKSKFTAKGGGAVMKFLFQLKNKMTPEKSLKAYAWYHWY
ncbi:tryptorubin family RiPP precursor [Streptomyces brevispora]|uniref:tryptorubin family RiPP precursor n=1 Tax=Streptomyces brevispora TaxID=887462 RepID=UPI0037124722